MYLIYLFFIAIANSIDNLGIRVAYSIDGMKVNALKNLVISLMAFIVSYIASFSGGLVSHFLSEEVCSIISMALLILMGVRMILECYLKRKDESIDIIKAIGYKEAISIGTALALDDIGGSASVGILGYNPVLVGFAFFIVSYFIFLSGNYMIKLFVKLKIGNKAPVIAGIIMIIIGISQVI